ncbi:MAG: RHS repeat-associated core domain-containing protein, partial [Anaerolineae bacterium]|nr:RHS repeat-associated core domain-containing protein [Anaerolineae bacterium]
QRVAMREGGTLTYLHRDHLGSASLATDENGVQVSALRYTPYGVTRSGDMPVDRRFTDQRWESGLGLYDYGARFYSPSLGRFISADTIIPESEHVMQLNRYTYAANNPIRHTDPTGHCITPLCIGEVALVITGLVLLTGCDAAQPTAPPRSPTPISSPSPSPIPATATTAPPTTTPTQLPTNTPLPTFTPTPLPGPAYTAWELNTAALIIAVEVGTGEFFLRDDAQVRTASTYVAWTMRNRIEIGDPCGEAGCPYDPDFPIRASSYGETFQYYDPYSQGLLPDTVDLSILEMVRAVWDLPAGTPNPIKGADYILSLAYYRLYKDKINVEPVFEYFWTPEGGTEQGIYFFTEWPVITP